MDRGLPIWRASIICKRDCISICWTADHGVSLGVLKSRNDVVVGAFQISQPKYSSIESRKVSENPSSRQDRTIYYTSHFIASFPPYICGSYYQLSKTEDTNYNPCDYLTSLSSRTFINTLEPAVA